MDNEEDEKDLTAISREEIEDLSEQAARSRVKALLSERERRESYMTRLIRKLQKLDADLAERREEVESLQRTLKLETSKKSEQAKSEQRERSQKSKLQEDRIREQLSEVLYRKPPSMNKKDSFDIETVLISFTRPNDSMCYNLTFRLDKDTKIEELREGACKYWGVVPEDYILMTMGNSKCHGMLNVKECFKHGELAQLNLTMKSCENTDISEAESKAIRPNSAKKNKFSQREAARYNKDGPERIQKFGDSYIPYLRNMGGVYFLLKLRDLKPSEHGSKIKLRDFFVYILLAAITFGSYWGQRPSGHDYWYTKGIRDHFKVRMPMPHHADGYDTLIPSFQDISNHQELWDWLNITLPAVVWGDGEDSFSKGLSGYNMMPGFLAIRVQNVKPVCDNCEQSVYCSDGNKRLVERLQNAVCYYDYIDEDTSEKADNRRLKLYWDYAVTVNVSEPSFRGDSLPWKYMSAEERFAKNGVVTTRGQIASYDASGYMADYRTDIPALDQLFVYRNDMSEMIRTEWINIRTRVVIVSLTTYNFDYDKWASCDFVFEMAPGGGVYASHSIKPFRPAITETELDLHYTLLDYTRLLIASYIIVFVGIAERRHKTKNHRPGVNYHLSLNGITDVGIFACSLAIVLSRMIHFMQIDTKIYLDLLFGNNHFHSSSGDSDIYNTIFIIEGVLFMLVMYRLTSLIRLNTAVYLVWHTIGINLKAFAYMVAMFMPTFVGFVFLANKVWGQTLVEFSMAGRSSLQMLGLISGSTDLTPMQDWDAVWASFFVCVFYVVVKCLLLNVFATIVVDSYYIVRLTTPVPKFVWDPMWFFSWACPGVLVSMSQELWSSKEVA